MDWIQQWQSKFNKQNGVASLVRTGGSRHTGLAAPPHRNIHHLPSTADYSSYRPEKAEEVLTFSDIKVSNNSSYTICNATITNNGRRTYTFIEVKGKFKNSSGTILDTDWTYAVGSEGLEPGESATIRLSVSKNYNISNCSLEVYDYEKD